VSLFKRQLSVFRFPQTIFTFSIVILLFTTASKTQVNPPNFTTAGDTARQFGVHEISLTGDGEVDNPFDTIATVTFVPPSGQAEAKQVYMFYDGEDIWRARVYVTEIGDWTWTSESEDDTELDGQSGTFTAGESDLRGMLKRAEINPRQWVTEDGQWFINVSDTAYRLFNGDEALWQEYIRDDAEMGVTSVRAGGLGGWAWGQDAESSLYAWDGDNLTKYNLDKFQVTDTRLQWMLDEYPDIYIQMILFGQINWQTDEAGIAWNEVPQDVRENTMRYMVARWAAFPQIFWLGVNDLSCSEDFPNNHRFAREVGRYVASHDPWNHLMSISPTLNMEFCYLGEEDADWVSYIHLQGLHELGAERIAQYQSYPLSVFLGEDQYEQNHPTRYPRNPDYFYRWLFWSWLLAGGSANYGGRYPVIQPYKQTGQIPFSLEGRDYTAALTGLNSAPYIQSYFVDRQIDLSTFTPDDSLVSDLDGRNNSAQRPELMRRGNEEFIIYNSNAVEVERFAKPDPDITPSVRVDLREAEGTFSVEWYRPRDGAAAAGETVAGGDYRELVSPWRGEDFVLRLVLAG
jgi:hypothetical protein